MNTYQILVQAIFVSRLNDAEPSSMRYGFYATFYVDAASPTEVAASLGNIVLERMRSCSVEFVPDGIFRTRVLIDELWELPEEKNAGRQINAGASFFRIGPFSAFYFVIKLALIEFFRTRSFVDLM
jgi:hypothetical protein